MADMGSKQAPTIGDLFSGAGLFSQAFLDAGGDVQFAIELDPLAAASYARNVGPHVRVASAEKLSKVPSVDVIIAGPPCQGFSTLGTRDPLDVRNKLCLVVPRWAKHCNAKVIVVENVTPFLESSHWKKMKTALVKAGYEVATWSLDAADYGVPQHRRRSFTIASKIGIPEPPPKLGRATAKEIFRRPRANDPMHVWPENSSLAASRIRLIPPGGDRRDILVRAPQLCPPSWNRIGCQATDGWGRIDPNFPANTLRTQFQNPSKGRYLHPTEDRVISLREGARLQQIPEHWCMTGHRTAITSQIGNGVPLGLGRAVAQQIISLF